MDNFFIDKFEIGSQRSFVIAEIGNNHNGSFERAIQMVDHAVEIGVDCVKFQLRHLDKVYREKTLKKEGEDLGTEYVLDLLGRFELSSKQHSELFDYCKSVGILYLCTPWDKDSIDFLEAMGVEAYKVASADLTNIPLLGKLSITQKPLILSTGMSTSEEIAKTCEFLSSQSAKFVFLHCNSTYPAPHDDINLNWMKHLKRTHPFVGYSGHERGIAVSLAARALGACVIERHFTLDRNMEGPDHAASLEKDEFSSLLVGIRQIEKALGSSNEERQFSQGEMINRENLAKSLVASKALKAGNVVKTGDIKVRSPGQGLSPQKINDLIGQTLRRDIGYEDFFYPSDIGDGFVEPRNYSIARPWGIPVRYHDFKDFLGTITPDLFEFHLSYSDMDLALSDYLEGEYEMGFVVHAPELFSNSKLMDLASPDHDYRRDSIKETQKVVDITRELKKYFPNTDKPLIVANVGGFTMDQPLDSNLIDSYYERFDESLQMLDLEGVELIPQTMAPFPWHFGGQRYQNLFLEADDIVYWCDKLSLRVCFDISHSFLFCNHRDIDFYEFVEKVAPFAAHLHLGDAAGVNGEGLQVGTGEIDFRRLGGLLEKGCSNASFIPEIWQGHKNRGEGFWVAMDYLEPIFQ